MHACAHALCPSDDADGNGEGHRGEEQERVDEGGGEREEGDREDERTAHQHEHSSSGRSGVHLEGEDGGREVKERGIEWDKKQNKRTDTRQPWDHHPTATRGSGSGSLGMEVGAAMLCSAVYLSVNL